MPKGKLNEVTAADKLESFRRYFSCCPFKCSHSILCREKENFVTLSFPTISSSGPNGAIIHYCPTPTTARPLTTGELYLCDSGGQYLDGTTDVTRTVSFGQPSPKEKVPFMSSTLMFLVLQCPYFPQVTVT